MEDISQVGFTTLHSNPSREAMNESNIMHEVFSTSHAPQEPVYQSNLQDSSWGGNYAHNGDDFSFISGEDNHYNPCNDFMMSSARYDSNMRSIEIGDLDEGIKTERMVENLRWVGMSNKDLETVNPITNYMFMLFPFNYIRCIIKIFVINLYFVTHIN